LNTYTHPVYAYVRPAELGGTTRHWPVIVAGAGPVGLTAAIDLALRGIDVLLVDEDDTVSVGSRAICWSKRTLEILDRLGCAERLVQKGVGWSVGRVFFRDEQVYEFNLLPGEGHRRPAFINLQQYWVEQFLVERLSDLAQAEVRWRSKVVGVEEKADRVALRIGSPDGEYTVHADWLIAADGAKSPIRSLLGVECEGQVFHDRFLIADLAMRSGFPAERRFWFDPPFHRNQSALLHRQADDVWRVDFQLGWDADPEEEKKPERIVPRIRAMLGDDARRLVPVEARRDPVSPASEAALEGRTVGGLLPGLGGHLRARAAPVRRQPEQDGVARQECRERENARDRGGAAGHAATNCR